MHNNTIFNQLQNFFSRHEFEKAVKTENGDRYVKKFTCWQQFTTLFYAQATSKNSLRDIITGLSLNSSKWYHIGINAVTRSNLSYANNNRSYKIYEKLFYNFLTKCRSVTPMHKFKFKNPLYSLDATIIDLCLSAFPWAKFRKAKGGIKLHSLLDHRGNIPSFLVITDAKQHEVKIAREVPLTLISDSIIVFDKAYIDFKWLKTLDDSNVSWVSRSKTNMQYSVIGQLKSNEKKGVIADEIIELNGNTASKDYPTKIRKITYYDKETDTHYEFITNNFKLSAYTICQIYKARWQVELFFKWIKQNLKIKTFLGTSKNAVMTQIWIAMIYYLLLSYIKYQTKYKHSLLVLTRIIKEVIFFKTNFIDLLSLNEYNFNKLRGEPDDSFMYPLPL